MKKKLIRLTESDLHRIVKESVRKIINEAGDTNRGQYLLGRLRHRQANSGGISDNNAMDYAYKSNGNSFSDAYREGFEDEGRFQARANDGGRKIVKNGYMEKKMEDMDILGKKFIDFIEKYFAHFNRFSTLILLRKQQSRFFNIADQTVYILQKISALHCDRHI